MSEYDIGEAFAAIEEELTASMVRNLKRHRLEEIAEGKEWEMWQAEQMRSLRKYRKQNSEKFQGKFSEVNGNIEEVIRKARKNGNLHQEEEILRAMRKGWNPNQKSKPSAETVAEFFKLNDRKLDALINATKNDFKRAETAILRMAEDQYRQIIFNAQVYANTGAGTYKKAVDMATKDFLSRGINCIEYANGARHTMSDYADMAIRTASKRAYLTGEGEKRQEWGISTVIMNKRGNPCPKCLPFAGKVLIDDVWSGGSAKDGPYPLMSKAMAVGLYHPRCQDSHTTYMEGVSDPPDDVFTREEINAIEQGNRQELQRQHAQRQADKFKRLADYSLDDENQKKYKRKAQEWEKQVENVKESDIMKTVEVIHKAVGAKSKNYDIPNPVTGEIVNLVEGSRIIQPKNHVMAGKGRERKIDCIDWLTEKHGGEAEEWTKEKGLGYIYDEYGDERKVELHWYQHPQIGKVEMKVKPTQGGAIYLEDD